MVSTSESSRDNIIFLAGNAVTAYDCSSVARTKSSVEIFFELSCGVMYTLTTSLVAPLIESMFSDVMANDPGS